MAKDKPDPKLSPAAKKAIKSGGIKRVVKKNEAAQKAAIKKVPPPTNPNIPPGTIR